MKTDLPRIKSKLFQQQVEALRASYLREPEVVLEDTIEALEISLTEHGLDDHPILADDAKWLIERIEELQDAFVHHDSPGVREDRLYCRFRKRYAACEVPDRPLR